MRVTNRSRRVVLGRLFGVTAAVACLGVVAAPPATADEIRDGQWPLQRFGAAQLWKITRGEGVVVAVLDSGVDASHPDLEGQVLKGADFVDGSTDGTRDLYGEKGHGTAMASIIAGRADDSTGVAGLAPRAKILPVRVVSTHSGRPEDIAEGIRFAVDRGAKVINMSLGSEVTAPVLEEALRYAYQHDVVVVAAAGNSGDTTNHLEYPSGYPGVVTVGAVDADAKVWSKSQHGPQLVVVAPGVHINEDRPGGRYGWGDGTSQAAAYVSATVALLRAKYPELTAGQVINRLLATARDDNKNPGWDEYFGYGLINPRDALTKEIPPGPPENPLLTKPAGRKWLFTNQAGGSSQAAQPGQPGGQGGAKGGEESGGNGAGLVVALVGGLLVLVVIVVLVVVLVRRGRSKQPPGPLGGGWPDVPQQPVGPQPGVWAGQQPPPPPGPPPGQWGPPRR